MEKNQSFALRMAILVGVGLGYALAAITFVDARLTSHRVFGARNYPCGYWIVIMGPLAGTLVYFLASQRRSRQLRIFGPAAVIVLAGLLLLPNFLPEFPHMGVIGTSLMLALATLGASAGNASALGLDFVRNSSVDVRARIERVKETITFWRMVATGIMLGFMAMLIPWVNSIWVVGEKFISNEDETFLNTVMQFSWLSYFTLVVTAGPVYEFLATARKSADALLEIRTEDAHEPLVKA